MSKPVKITSIILSSMMLLTSCGLSPEEITSTIDTMSNEYQSGNYDEAYEHISKLDKSYKKMTDEQKSTYDETKKLVVYAHDNIDKISEAMTEIKALIDQQLYYEANTEIESISSNYVLPPGEQTLFTEYKTAIDIGIQNAQVNAAFNEISVAFNNNDYDTAKAKLNTLNKDALTVEQQQSYELWHKKSEELSKLIDAQTNYNNGKYSTAASRLTIIDSSLLNQAQIDQCSELQKKIDAAVAEIKRKEEEEKKRLTGEKAIALVKAKKGNAPEVQHLKFKYSYYDKGTYYLVCATATAYADGTDKYRVYKADSSIEYIGCASDWTGTDAEECY